jgi:transposase
MDKKPLPAVAEPLTRSAGARRFSDEFKHDAVRLISEERYTFKAAAAAVGVSEKSMRDWHAKFAPQPSPCGEDATVEELRQENKRLRQQLKRAELEREILKKATAYFAKESL